MPFVFQQVNEGHEILLASSNYWLPLLTRMPASALLERVEVSSA